MKPPQPLALACTNSAADLNRYVSGECEPDESAGIERHLPVCAVCGSFVENRRRIRTALRATLTADGDVPAELLTGIRERLREDADRRTRGFAWRPLAMAAGIVLVATGAIGAFWLGLGDGTGGNGSGQAVARLEEDASHHHRCIQEMAGRMPPSASAGGSLDADVARVEAIVRDRAAAGTTVAAAHRCTDGQRRYVHVVLEREGALAGVLVSDAERQGGGPDGLPVVASARRASFHTAGHVVTVVSDAPGIDASALAEGLRPVMATGRRVRTPVLVLAGRWM